MPAEPSSELTKMKVEINTLEKLQNMYNQVRVETEIWDVFTFSDLQKEQDQIGAMRDTFSKFSGDGKKLGRNLKK